jgi:hypothetical protein
MGTEGKTPGDGKTNPFGDAKGATQAAGKFSGAHDFTVDPTGSGSKTGGKDFNAEEPKEVEDDIEPNKESVPTGGKILFADPPAGSKRTSPVGAPGSSVKPFRLSGA